jgi:L-fuculose-phosphate aldolase
MKARLYLAFQQVGADLFAARLASATSGNFSVRDPRGLWITRSGAQKAHLQPEDLLLLPTQADPQADQGASVERIVHRAIYQQTGARAVVHAHPRFAIALSYSFDQIVPIDLEGSYYFPSIPVVSPSTTSGTEEVAQAVAGALVQHKACIVRGHGAFARSELETPDRALLEAFALITSLEEACEVLYHQRLWAALHPGG